MSKYECGVFGGPLGGRPVPGDLRYLLCTNVDNPRRGFDEKLEKSRSSVGFRVDFHSSSSSSPQGKMYSLSLLTSESLSSSATRGRCKSMLDGDLCSLHSKPHSHKCWNMIVAPPLGTRLLPPTAARPMTKALASEAPLCVGDLWSHATVQVTSFDKHRKHVTLKS